MVCSVVQGMVCSVVQGMVCSVVQGMVCSVVQEMVCSVVKGMVCSVVQEETIASGKPQTCILPFARQVSSAFPVAHQIIVDK
jgi:molybdopterin-binding protein